MNHLLKYRTLAAGFITALCMMGTSVVAAPSAFDRANSLYQSGQTLAALQLLEPLLKANPADAAAHYLKANCLTKLNQLPKAITEYSLAERLSPGSQLADYCRQSRLSIDNLLQAKAKTIQDADKSDHVPDTENTSPTKSGSTSLPQGTLEMIRHQAEKAKERAIETGKAEADGEVQKANNQARSLQEKAERMAATRGTEPVQLSPQQLEAVRAQAAADAERLKALGQLKAGSKEQESQAKAEEIQRQADNLQDQLVNDRPYQSSDIKLNPVGTNLYIRNYSSVPPRIAPLHAQAKKLPPIEAQSEETSGSWLDSSGRLINGPDSGARLQTAHGQTGSQKRAVTSVKARVLP